MTLPSACVQTSQCYHSAWLGLALSGSVVLSEETYRLVVECADDSLAALP